MYTYLVKTEGLDLNTIENMFKKRGNWKPHQSSNYADFIHLDTKYYYDRTYWTFTSDIRSIVGDEKYKIGDKNLLYQNLHKLNPKICEKYMMKQHYININDKISNRYEKLFKNNEIWILKPVEGYVGKGIVIITTAAQLTNSLRSVQQNLNKQYKDWVLSKYLEKPLLFKDRKFHLRMYFLYTNDGNNNRAGYLHKIGRLAVAKNRYKLSNFDNKTVHDTHFKGMDTDYYFPKDFIADNINKNMDKKILLKNIADIYLQIFDLFHYIFQLIEATCYKETKKCYELFGCDLMITPEYKIKLLEINTKTSMDSIDAVKFTELYFGGILEQVIDKWLPPKNEQEKQDYFIKIE